jgi:LDH2 family malate/lactate/ureidoglycolate dehydrogenase
MRIDAFRPASEFKDIMDKWILTFRNSKPDKQHEKVLIPGDPERELEKIRMKEGIPVMHVVIEKINQIAEELGLEKI